jgi:hypothetical protein
LDDTTAIIIDESTSSQTVLEDFTQVFDNLGKTLTILNQHTGTINYITEQYLDITANQTNILNEIADLQYTVNDIARDITGTEGAIAMFSDGNDPLVDSSIFVNNGNIGFFTTDASYPVQIDKNLKTKDIYIESAIKDTSGYILLGYGSPIQIGSSLNKREVKVYTGNLRPAILTDVSNNVYFDGSIYVNNTKIAISNYMTDACVASIYVPNASLGSSFKWSGGKLDVSISNGGNVKWASGAVGANNQLLTAAGDASIVAESTLTWDTYTLSLNTTGNAYIKISDSTISQKNLYIQGSTIPVGNGGNIEIAAGNTGGYQTGGNITIKSGTGGYRDGNITIDPNSNLGKLYFQNIPAGTGNHLALFGTQVVQVTSDIKFKTNIKYFDSLTALEKVLQLKGCTFDYKTGETNVTGMIAQDVEEILPELVGENPDKEGMFKYIKYEGITPFLIESIKELYKTINKLQEKIENLEKQINL